MTKPLPATNTAADPSDSRLVRVNLTEELRYFDRCPRSLRDALNDSLYNYSSKQVWELYQRELNKRSTGALNRVCYYVKEGKL